MTYYKRATDRELSEVIHVEESGFDFKGLNVGDRFFITDESNGGADWILDEALVEFKELSKSKRKLVVRVIRKTGGYMCGIMSCGEIITCSPELCFSRVQQGVSSNCRRFIN